MTRRATVAQVRAVLDRLDDEDELFVNQVSNLTVVRDGIYLGHVGLADDEVTDRPGAELRLYDDD